MYLAYRLNVSNSKVTPEARNRPRIIPELLLGNWMKPRIKVEMTVTIPALPTSIIISKIRRRTG